MPPVDRLLASKRPRFELEDGENERLGEALLQLQVQESVDGLHHCQATFGNWGTRGRAPGFLYFDRQVLDFGKTFRVKLDDNTLFDGRILGLEAAFPPDRPPEITVLAEDRLQDLRMTRRTRTFADQSDADVFRQIAGDHGLSPELDVDGPTHKILAQLNQSDLAFLRERARALGVELSVDGSTLRAGPRAAGGNPLELPYGNQLREFTVLADLAHQRTALVASGWDVGAKSELRHEAGDDCLGGELENGESGASVLRSALGERKESVAHAVPLSGEEARTVAEAAFRLGARRFLRGRGIVEPVPGLRVGATVDLTGLGPLFSGAYYLCDIVHRFDGRSGFRTEFTAERPWLGRP